MECRKGCGACCIFLDISSSIPNHPSGKPSGIKCKNLDSEDVYAIIGKMCQYIKSDNTQAIVGEVGILDKDLAKIDLTGRYMLLSALLTD